MSDLPIPADDFESVLEDYPIKLEHFEGPLDLLLHLIRKKGMMMRTAYTMLGIHARIPLMAPRPILLAVKSK